MREQTVNKKDEESSPQIPAGNKHEQRLIIENK